MRLGVLDHGHPLKTKALFAFIRLMSGHRAPDVVKTLRYRADFFGARMGLCFRKRCAARRSGPWPTVS